PSSVSSPRRRGSNSLNDRLIQIVPLRILRLDQVHLPVPIPFLDLLFTRDRPDGCLVHLEPDQPMNAVVLAESGDYVVLVLPHAPNQIVRNPDVQSLVHARGEDVHVVMALHGLPTRGRRSRLQAGVIPGEDGNPIDRAHWIPAYA